MNAFARSELHLTGLRASYRSGALTPARLVDELAPVLDVSDSLAIWIHRVPTDALRAAARALERCERGPLWGVPFAVKDNIDVAGVPTTAACPAFSYVPTSSATVVERLIVAGALFVGKTNLDQFATGLVGVRSPYGAPPNPFAPACVPGGSSSGSAAAVARGLVSFALGTDTAGSARVPAALTNTVGLKPSRGLLSLRGVVPACRSIDCVSVQALTVEDAVAVARVAAGYDADDPYSRREGARVTWREEMPRPRFRFGIPDASAQPLGDRDTEAAFARAVAMLRDLGGTPVPVDFAPLFAAARLLYEGPWVAERLAALETFVARNASQLLPVTRDILLGAAQLRATDAFAGLHELAVCRRAADEIWAASDVLVVPTVPEVPTLADVAASPIAANARLGRYTNFVNLLDLAALAVPNGFRSDGSSTGITLIAPWGHDGQLAVLGSAFHRAIGGSLGATPWKLPTSPSAASTGDDEHAIAVVGAHLSGQPLNVQLVTHGARLVATTRTSASYKLYALAGTTPAKPGLIRVAEGGAAIELEVWAMPRTEIGAFLALVPAPLCLGSIVLESGESVTGFLCEPHAIASARDITELGGWRAYLRSARGA
jgi:allophanate hydrolase